MDGSVTAHHVTGELQKIGTITGSLQQIGTVTGTLSVPALRPVEKYDGPHKVTPMWTEQRLETEGKQLTEDIKVFEIPIYKTSNPSGGDTVIIGG